MKNLLLALCLVFSAHSAMADIIGTPFIPEEDTRFDILENVRTITAYYNVATDGGTSAAAISLNKSLPANAVVKRAWFGVLKQFAPNNAKLELKCGTTSLSAPASISGASPFQFVDLASTGQSAMFISLSSVAPCGITANDTITPFTAGKLKLYIEYLILQ